MTDRILACNTGHGAMLLATEGAGAESEASNIGYAHFFDYGCVPEPDPNQNGFFVWTGRIWCEGPDYQGEYDTRSEGTWRAATLTDFQAFGLPL